MVRQYGMSWGQQATEMGPAGSPWRVAMGTVLHVVFLKHTPTAFLTVVRILFGIICQCSFLKIQLPALIAPNARIAVSLALTLSVVTLHTTVENCQPKSKEIMLYTGKQRCVRVHSLGQYTYCSLLAISFDKLEHSWK